MNDLRELVEEFIHVKNKLIMKALDNKAIANFSLIVDKNVKYIDVIDGRITIDNQVLFYALIPQTDLVIIRINDKYYVYVSEKGWVLVESDTPS